MRKILSSVLCLAMLASMVTPVFAAGEIIVGDVDTGTTTTFDTNTATTTADLTAEALVFDLEVPSSLPISVDTEGKVEVATDAKITNNSGGMVKVTNVSLDTTDSGWTIVDYETDFTQEKVGLTQFGMTLNSDEVATDGSLSLGSEWESLSADGGTLGIDYEVNVASQSSALSLSTATVEFTLDWDSVEAESQLPKNVTDIELTSLYMDITSISSKELSGTVTYEGEVEALFENIIWEIKDNGGISSLSVSDGILSWNSQEIQDQHTYTMVLTATYIYENGSYTEDFTIQGHCNF